MIRKILNCWIVAGICFLCFLLFSYLVSYHDSKSESELEEKCDSVSFEADLDFNTLRMLRLIDNDN